MGKPQVGGFEMGNAAVEIEEVPAPEIEKRFLEEMRWLLHERLSIGFVVATFIFPFYIYQDFRMDPPRWHELAILRLSSSLLCLLGLALNKTRLGERHPYPLVLVMFALLCTMKTFITSLKVSGMDSLYFGGHILFLVGALSLLPFSWWKAVALAVSGHLGWIVPNLLFAKELDPLAFYIQNTLMFTVWLLLCLGCHLNFKTRYREFRLRRRLHAARVRASDYG